MSTYRVDDGDAAVIYSKPATGGHWNKQDSGASYQNGLMLTRHRNANATLSFTGTSISVYGLVSPGGTGGTQMSSYNVDGENTKTYTASPTSATQRQTLFYNSGTLSNGPHTLVLVNLVELDYFWIDYFEITTASDAAPAVGGTTAAAPLVSGQTTAKAAAPSIQTTAVTQIFTSVIVESSTTRLFVLTTTKSEVVQADTTSTGSVNQLTQSLTNADASQSSGTSYIDAGGSTASASKAPIGAIVGGVVGGIAVVILAIILFVLLKRRGRRANVHDMNDGMSSKAGGPARPWAQPPRQGDLVVPFVDAPTVASIGTSSAYSQPSLQPSGPQYGSFNQGHMAASYSGGTYNTSTSPPAAGPTGKRQYLNANEDVNASSAALLGGRQRDMEQIHSTATSTAGYSDPLDLPPMAIEDLPPSYQAAAASQPSGNSVLEGLANARKS